MNGALKQSDVLRDCGLDDDCFRALMEASPDAIVITDEQGRVVEVNTRAETGLGYRRDELLGRPAEVLLAERSRLSRQFRPECGLAFSQAGPAAECQILWALHRDGVEIPVEITSHPLKTPCGPLVMSIIRDVSEREKANEELAKQERELARTNAELERFTYVASHDLREPLRKVQVFGSRLKVSVGQTLPADERTYLDRMIAATERMESLIDALLEYSRAKQRPDRLELVDLGQTVSEVLEGLRIRIDYIKARVELGALPAVQADPEMMRLLFHNLLTNALKFRKLLGTHVVKITAEERGSEVYIWIEDNGVGFDPALSERIFELFKRAHGRDRYDGTGIGLATCRRIVENHGGRLSGVGKPEEGAVFEVVLPTGKTG